MSAREAARLLGVSERTLWTQSQAGSIPFVKIGDRRLYPTDALRQWIADQLAAQRKGGGA